MKSKVKIDFKSFRVLSLVKIKMGGAFVFLCTKRGQSPNGWCFLLFY